MPRVQSTKKARSAAKPYPKQAAPLIEVDGIPCTLCKVTIANKSDMPRHMRIHAENKDMLMFRCAWEGCQFKNLQKSNVETHMRTHLKIKNKFCPDCPNAFTDPGSLTRHRKRRHNYVPEPRKARSKVPKASVSTPSSTASRLPSLSPPPRGLSVESTATDRTGYTSESTGSHSSQESSDREFDFHVYTVLTPEFPSYLAPSMTSKSCVIKNEQVSEAEPTICYSKFVDTLKERTPSPKPLLPAVEAGTSLGDLSYQELLRLLSPEPEVLMLECEAPKPQYNVGALVAPVAQYPQQQQVLSNAELFHQTNDEVDWSWMDDQVFQSNCTGITEQYDNNNIDAYSFDGFATGPVSPSLDFASTPLFEASPSYADEYSTVIPPMTEEEEQLLEQILGLSNQ